MAKDKTKNLETVPLLSQDPAAEFEHHVDEMMDKSLPDPRPQVKQAVRPTPAHDDKPVDLADPAPRQFATAPEVNGSAVRTLGADTSLVTAKDATLPKDDIENKKLADPTESDSQTSADSPELALAAKPSTADIDVGATAIASADDSETDEIIDDIVSHESDELLAARDAEVARATAAPAQKPTFGSRIKGFLVAWWHHRPARYATIFLLLGGIIALGALPTSRYYAMNTVGMRSAASLIVIDNTTQLPLKNVTVELGDRKSKTNQDGLVKLSGLKHGTQSLAVQQPGFATITRTVTIGWGSNPLGDFVLEAVGTQFRFNLTDFLSGKPVKNAEIVSGDANAKADNKGQLVLTLGELPAEPARAKITADGYRAETVTLNPGEKQNQTLVMVPRQKEVYVTKQSGKYDLYKMDIDGKNKQLLLAASGQEDANITIVQHTSADQVALVSKRDTKKNQDGFVLQNLTLINVAKGTTLSLDSSEQIRIVDWTNDKLIYVKVKAGTSGGNPERYQLMSYDYDSTARLQLATANYFGDVISAKGTIYYAASNNYNGGTSHFSRINPDNTGKQTLLDKTDVYSVVRTSYDTLSLTAQQGTYEYKIGDPATKKISDSSVSTNDRKYYLDSPDGKHALWLDSRDGKGVLLDHDAATSKDKILVSQTGLNQPVRWLNNRTIVYRLATPRETADYVVSIDGGPAKKITDLTNTAGLGLWSFR